MQPNYPGNELIVNSDVVAVDEILDHLSCKSVFLVADALAYESSGAKRSLDKVLASRRHAVFSDFRPNPDLGQLLLGLRSYATARPDVVLAVGGGTAIDLAKLIRFCAAQSADPRDLIMSPAANPRPGVPLIAVPTTAGTGSEATHFAVVYVDDRKHSLAHRYVRPDFAVVDASLTENLPPHLTAETGLDALCQAIESMWSTLSTDESLRDATEAVQLVWQHLAAAVNAPAGVDRLGMCRAAHLAGRAINVSKTTAPHAISYTLTSAFNVSHGRAVALTIGPLMAFNSKVTMDDCNDPRGSDYVRETIDRLTGLLGCRSADEADQRLQQFIASIGCPIRLAEVGVTTAEQLNLIVDRVNLDRMANNPRRLTNQCLRDLLQSIH